MATNGHQIRESFVAGADLSSAQFTFVKMNTTDRTVVAAGNADAADGVLINDPGFGWCCNGCYAWPCAGSLRYGWSDCRC
jgi:hypothetical protein